ncbi:MAG: anti-anti-sigma factor [Paraglaciecola sp.]|jgi:anti-anti-sigma factor
MSETQTIGLPERFDFGFHRQFLELSQQAFLNDGCKHIILDFSRVTYIDSSALGMIVLLHKKAKSASISTSVSGAKGAAAEVLNMTNLDQLFDIT